MAVARPAHSGRTARTACPLDCNAVCGLVATVVDGRVTALTGDPRHPVTRGTACHKTAYLVAAANHPERLLHPLGRTAGGFRRLTWDEALDRWAEALADARRRFGPTSVLHYTDSGSQGLLKALDRRFFAHFGGATVPRGSLCFAAGLAAQTYDFGVGCHHEPEDLLNAGAIVLWGANPLDTNVQLARVLREAKRRSIPVVVVDPLRTRTASLADRLLQPEPGTDAALAQALARELIVTERHAREYLAEQTVGFPPYRERAMAWTVDRAAAVTGLAPEEIQWLAGLLSARRPVAFIVGWGLQRYRNGGATVRAIDALGAVAGSVGIPGGGVSYAHRHWKGLAPLDGRELPQTVREVRRALLAQDLEALEGTSPPVAVSVIARTNPACQSPETGRLSEALQRIPFKVYLGHFLNDTARLADLVLPATMFLEEEDVYAACWSRYAAYGPKVSAPPGECRTEQEVYRSLAERLALKAAATELARSPRQWLAETLAPLGEEATERLFTEGVLRHPAAPAVPFLGGRFPTPSGKLELWSERAAREGQDPLAGINWPWPELTKNGERPSDETEAGNTYPYRLLSPQPRHRLHSTFGNVPGPPMAENEARIHPATGKAAGVGDGERAVVESEVGRLTIVVRYDPGVREGVVVIPNGTWSEHGGSVNQLIPMSLTDMGDQAAQYEARCSLRRVW